MKNLFGYIFFFMISSLYFIIIYIHNYMAIFISRSILARGRCTVSAREPSGVKSMFCLQIFFFRNSRYNYFQDSVLSETYIRYIYNVIYVSGNMHEKHDFYPALFTFFEAFISRHLFPSRDPFYFTGVYIYKLHVGKN